VLGGAAYLWLEFRPPPSAIHRDLAAARYTLAHPTPARDQAWLDQVLVRVDWANLAFLKLCQTRTMTLEERVALVRLLRVGRQYGVDTLKYLERSESSRQEFFAAVDHALRVVPEGFIPVPPAFG